MRILTRKHRPDFDDFTRWTLIELFGRRLVLHVFKKDDHHCMHDHPYNILSIMIWGKYVEITEDDMGGEQRTLRRAPSIWWIPAKRVHKIELVRGKAYTLCFFGKKFRDWGFTVKGLWVESKEYFKKFGNRGGCNAV